MDLKYVMYTDSTYIIFPSAMPHDYFPLLKTPVSAGNVEFACKANQVSVNCFGKSISLRLKSRPEDSTIILRDVSRKNNIDL